MRRTRQDLGFVALKVEGGILPAEFLQKVVALEAKGQSGKDYKLPKGTTIKDEIGRAWRIASAEWREYRENCERQDIDRTRIGIDQWLVTLLKVALGHDDIASHSVVRMGDRTFPITHKSVDGAVPLVLTTENFRLDKTDARFGEEGRRRSPHALMQEFLNANDDCLWGAISNGRVLQLLRDNPSLTKPAYIEADLERIFEEQLYSDFAAMWLIFHGSRFACGDGKPSECFMEEWRKEGHETGERALADLRKGVTTALRELGNGFLQSSQNTALREALKSGVLSPEDYFRELLRLVYRLLFILCVEDRGQIHPIDSAERGRWLYKRGYSLSRLRECALLKRNYDKHHDMWEGLQVTFQGLRKGESNLALPALGGLFVQSHCPYIEQSGLENQYLLRAVFALSFFRTGDVLARVNYRDMGTEELGSVYESLLELHPFIDVDKSPWTFEFVGEGEGTAGSERKLSGSYYTPASLVNELLRTAVDPVIEEAKRNNPDNPRKALLELKVIDPACGSGHFLLAAARRLAIEIARLDQAGEMSEEAARRHALREVIQSCIYGVDKNELALELCKTALWIEAVEPGRPLNFLDAHLRCGDSLVGILNPDVIEKGVPDEAYAPLAGDDKATVSELKRKNKDDKYEHSVVQGSLFDQRAMTVLTDSRAALNNMPEETIEQIELKQQAFKEWLAELDQSQEEVKANLFVGAFFAHKTKETIAVVPRTEDLNRMRQGLAARSGVVDLCRALAERYKFFHWHLAFSEVFKKGGFDIVLGNPPWERIKLQEKEFFESRRQEIAAAKNKAERERLVKALFLPSAAPADKRLGEEFTEALRGAEAASSFIRGSSRYPLCGRGDINTYAIFSETMRAIVGGRGRLGCIVPSGIATDDTTKFFFQDLMSKKSLVSLFDFENRDGIFPGVHRSYKFSLMTLAGSQVSVPETEFVFFALETAHINEEEKQFRLSATDISLLNPNTGTCAIFRSKRDAELTKKIFRKVPVLIKDGPPVENPWKVSFVRMFDMTNDAQLFRSREELESDNHKLEGNVFIKSGEIRLEYLPLYEAKLLHQFDHRWATYDGLDTRDVAIHEKENVETVVLPRYWIESSAVGKITHGRWERKWFIGWRDICRSTDERTVIATVLPWAGVGNKIPLMFIGEEYVDRVPCLLANLCAFVFDYASRQKIGGITLNFFILKQLPVLSPERYSEQCPWMPDKKLSEWITPRVIELVYTSSDMLPFASDFGYGSSPFVWNDERREQLRAELDAAYFHLYGMSRNDVEFILDTFPIIKRKEEDRYGVFRTKGLILQSFDEIASAIPTDGMIPV